MANFDSYKPTTIVTRAMFNFDATGGTNYTYNGIIRVSVSDSFSVADQSSRHFFSELYTRGAPEVNWTATMQSGVQETLQIIQQFVKVDLRWQGDIDTLGTKSVVNPADVASAHLADINISLVSRNDTDWVGLSGGNTDQTLEYRGSAGDIFIDRYYFGNDTDFDLGSPSRTTLMHELLHDLGLSHPHSDYNNGIPIITTDFAATRTLGFDKLGFRTATAADMYKEYFTIMSYDDQSVGGEPHTPMILDVIALQQAYGEGTGSQGTGNDTIEIGTSGYRVYFDKGGIDTIDLKQFASGAYLHMGTRILGAGHLVGVAMSAADGAKLHQVNGDPENLRWFYGEFENATASAGPDKVIGNALANHVSGLAGADQLYGNGGNDVLDGGAGADFLAGGAGNDRLLGGLGSDTADFAAAVRGVTLNLNLSSAQVTGGAGTDTLYSIENLNGSNYADHLIGNAARNVLHGGKGADVLVGAAGDDTLNGNAGNDRLSGGAGKDVFIFDKSALGSIDQILDFRAADDTLKLDNALFAKLTKVGSLSPDNYRESNAGTAHDANDFILYNPHNGGLFYDADGNGAGHANQFATLWDGHHAHPLASQVAPLDFLVV